MKALIILLSGPFMLFFLLFAVQTVEYCMEFNETIPWQIYGLFGCVAVWCVAACKCNKQEINSAYKKYEQFLDKIFHPKVK